MDEWVQQKMARKWLPTINELNCNPKTFFSLFFCLQLNLNFGTSRPTKKPKIAAVFAHFINLTANRNLRGKKTDAPNSLRDRLHKSRRESIFFRILRPLKRLCWLFLSLLTSTICFYALSAILCCTCVMKRKRNVEVSELFGAAVSERENKLEFFTRGNLLIWKIRLDLITRDCWRHWKLWEINMNLRYWAMSSWRKVWLKLFQEELWKFLTKTVGIENSQCIPIWLLLN